MDGQAACRQGRRAELRFVYLAYDGAAGIKKTHCSFHRSKYWKIPPEGSAAFVANTEDVLAVHHLPYDPDYPVVCLDESCKQMIGEVYEPIPCAPGRPARIDDEYVRNGVAEIFMAVELLAGTRYVAVTERRTKKDWAMQVQQMLDVRYPHAIKVRLILDNLNTHRMASLCETFPPDEARRLAARLEIHYTPKHGSWLNMAEVELSVLKGQCPDRRIPDLAIMQAEVAHGQQTETTAQRQSIGNSLRRTLGSS